MSLASDAFRSELIFLPDDGSVTRIDGGYVMLTPSNPTFWWGNTLRYDRPPRDGDFERWNNAFETHVHAAQPASTHRTFGWDGDDRGEIGRFVEAGFEHDETIGLQVDRSDAVGAPKRDPRVEVVMLSGPDWNSMRKLQVDTRDDPPHSAADHDTFIARRIVGWRALEARGQGHWFGIRNENDEVVSALGVFAEASRGADGRRIGRFQHVTTHPSHRRRGLAGMLVEHASRFAFAHLDVDTLHISADANDVARRVYEGCGYRVRTTHHGLERAN